MNHKNRIITPSGKLIIFDDDCQSDTQIRDTLHGVDKNIYITNLPNDSDLHKKKEGE